MDSLRITWRIGCDSKINISRIMLMQRMGIGVMSQEDLI